MKQIIKQGTPKIFTATCPECGCEFTFMTSDKESELEENSSVSYEYPLHTPILQEYVTCPCCYEKVRSWKE